MCTECGCGLPGERPAKISGGHAHDHDPPHEHEHVHADGTRHSHPHHHPHENGHDHPHDPEVPHDHSHSHGHSHAHSHDSGHHHHEHEQEDSHANQARRTVEIRQAILAKNERLAERNRGFFIGRGLLAINVVSSPGSGKTTFLRETIKALGNEMKAGVIVGDLATDNDAVRLREAGAPVVQVTTGTVCHLEAEMVSKALGALPLENLKLIVIENVGNLVCPASYDLGEHLRVVLLSVTEGEDKPLKYPPMFQSANVVIVSKMDLAEPCAFDREKALANIRRVSPGAKIFEVSSKSGQGMKEWCEYLKTTKAGY